MTDEAFLEWLHGYTYGVQCGGGTSPVLNPIKQLVPVYKNDDGTINRARTLDRGFSTIAGVVREGLLKTV